MSLFGHNFDIITFYKSLTSTHFTFIPFVLFSTKSMLFLKMDMCEGKDD